jgi:hypothetical protein
MEKAMKDIFTEGSIVDTLKIPSVYPAGKANTKKEWGAMVLEDYVSRLFGKTSFGGAEESRSHNNSLTGTTVVVVKDNQRHTFMLVEPRGSFGKEVHVSQCTDSLLGGSINDVIDHELAQKPVSASPFAWLASIKEGLPEKHDLVTVIVQEDKKFPGKLILRPDYLEADPLADNSPSMRFYHLCRKMELIKGQKFRAKICEVFRTGRKNAKGSDILHLNVEVLK